MSKRVGLILSAGKETRFSDDKPKALSIVKDGMLLDLNRKLLQEYCDDVYVVCSTQNERWFKGYKRLIIESGYGCGDAVMKALQQAPQYSQVMIAWGDCILQKQVIDDCFYKLEWPFDIVIPCTWEVSPYVRLKEIKGSIKVEFGKYGEVEGDGFHDYGFFYGDTHAILSALEELCNEYRTKDGYKHKHGNEIEFLDIFNETTIIGRIVPSTAIALSFNTKEELNEIR